MRRATDGLSVAFIFLDLLKCLDLKKETNRAGIYFLFVRYVKVGNILLFTLF